MERKVYYKYLFVIGAIFALAVGIPIFVLFLFYNPGLTPAGQLYNLFFRIDLNLNSSIKIYLKLDVSLLFNRI